MRVRRLLTYYSLQLANQLIRIFAQLLLVPLFLKHWGPIVYKDWVVLTAIMTFVGICDFGIASYFRVRFIDLVARDDRVGLQKEVRVALLSALCVGIAVLSSTYAILFYLNSHSYLNFSGFEGEAIIWCFLFLTVSISFSFCEEILRSLYYAHAEFSRGEGIFAIYNSAIVLSIAALLAFDMSPVVVSLVYFIVPVILASAVCADVLQRYPDIGIRFRIPRIGELRQIVPQSLLLFTFPLSQTLVVSAPIMLFAILGVPALSILTFTMIRTITGLVRQGAYQFAAGTGIEMARDQAQGEYERCRDLYYATGQIVTGLAGLFGGFVTWATAPFLRLWTSAVVPDDPYLVACFMACLFLAAPGQGAAMLLTYRGEGKPLAVAWCSLSAAGLFFSVVLVPIFGVLAAALSFGLAEVLSVGVFLPLVVQRRFGFSASYQLIWSFAVGISTFAWSALAAYLIFGFQLKGFNGFVETAVLWALLAAPVFALLVAPDRYRKMLFARR
jgi:O-antigen/teichoic acid export membrane protein